MQNCGNETLQSFVEKLVETITDCDNGYDEDVIVKKDMIPFVVSSLWQSFRAEPSTFKEFIKDLEKYAEYQIHIIRPTNDYYGICDLQIYLYDSWSNITQDFSYQIQVYYDPRDLGYCECTLDMKDYREDKHCCGHGCDWWAPSFSLHKVMDVYQHTWDGDEHDFWDFEDDFYKSEFDLEEQKKKLDREYEIKQIQERMKADEQRLKELMENN